MKGEVTCIMCTWKEEQMAPLAIESSKDFVKRYIVIDKDGSTVPTIDECRKKWNLDMDIFIKPKMTLRESRAYAARDIEEPWILIQDGDEVFHTDGPNSIFTLRRFMVRPNIVLCSPMATLSCDFHHTDPMEPTQDPHKFLYHNNGTLRAPDKKQDLPIMDGWEIFLDRIYKFNCRIKSPRRMFLRQFWDEWCKNSDAYLEFPTLEEYVVKKLAIDIESESDDWYKKFMETLIPYDKKKWGYYPKILRRYLAREYP